MRSNAWLDVTLGNVLRLDLDRVNVEAAVSYPMVGVYSFGKGLFKREPVVGANTSYRFFNRLKSNHVVMSQLFGWEGALALSSPDYEGLFVSPQFPTFICDQEQLDRRFLGWLMRRSAFWKELGGRTKGMGDRRRTLNPDALLICQILLPPLAEQRRIVARIEELAAKIEEARGLRQEAEQEVNLLVPRRLSQVLNDAQRKLHRLEEVLLEPPRNGLAPQTEVTDGEIPMLRINAVSSSPTRFVDTTARKMVSVPMEIAGPFVLRNDDVFIVRYNGDINRVAKAAIFKTQEPVTIVYPDKLMRLRADRSKIIPDFLVYALGCQSVRSQIEEMGKTTAGQIGVSGKDAKSFRIPVPSIEEQSCIVTYLDDLQAKVDALKKLQVETAAELDALLPSILDKAFKGEL